MSDVVKQRLNQAAKTKIEELPKFRHYAIHEHIDGKEVKVLRCDKYSDYALSVHVVWLDDAKKAINGMIEVAEAIINDIGQEQNKKLTELFNMIVSREGQHKFVDLDFRQEIIKILNELLGKPQT